MQAIELHSARVVLRDVVDDSHFVTERHHLAADGELRDQRKNDHQRDENMAQREGMSSAAGEVLVRERTNEKDNAGCNANPVQDGECAVYDSSGQLARGQNSENRWRKYERKENDAADPGDEGEKHKKAKRSHKEILVVSSEL